MLSEERVNSENYFRDNKAKVAEIVSGRKSLW